MSDIDNTKEALKSLSQATRDIVGCPLDVDKITKKQIADLNWTSEGVGKALKVLKIEQLKALCKSRNQSIYKSRGLDSPSISKDKLILNLCDPEFVSNYRPAITKSMRSEIWRKSFGNTFEGKCICCDTTIVNATDFISGHIVSVKNGCLGGTAVAGGTASTNNIVPVCFSCNSSMAEEDMDYFMERNGYAQNYATVHAAAELLRTSGQKSGGVALTNAIDSEEVQEFLVIQDETKIDKLINVLEKIATSLDKIASGFDKK